VRPRGIEPFTLAWIPAGLTAGNLFFVRRFCIEAASVLMSGLDEAEDAKALVALRCAVPAAAKTLRLDSLPLEDRPVQAFVHVDAAASAAAANDDVALRAAAEAWGMVFFGMLGLTSDRAAPLLPSQLTP